MSRRRISDEVRRSVVADINAAEKTRKQIAEDHGIAKSTVTNIAAENGLTSERYVLQTRAATEVHKYNAAHHRVMLQQRFQEKAAELLDEVDKRNITVWSIGGRDNAYTEHIAPGHTAAEIRALMVAAAVSLDKALLIEKHDAEPAEVSGSLLIDMITVLRQRHSPDAIPADVIEGVVIADDEHPPDVE